MNQIDIEKIKSLSIRGRVAFCAACLEKVQSEFNLKTKEMDKIINTLWEFTQTDVFDKWEIKATEISPDTILEAHPDNKFEDYESLSVEELENLKNFYLTLPREILEMVSWSFEVGQSNLYGNTGDYSKPSFQAVRKVLKLMELLKIAPPNLETFTFSKFSEEFGWGKPFSKTVNM